MKRLAFALVAVPVAAFAQSQPPAPPDVWLGAHPSVEISVKPSTAPGTFVVAATVKDLRNSSVLAKPVMLVKAGAPARMQIGAEGLPNASGISLSVTVADDGKTAAYASEVRTNGEIVSEQKSTLAIL